MKQQTEFSILGSSVIGLPIEHHVFYPALGQKEKARILVLGGVHGDESEGVTVALGLLNELYRHYSFPLVVSVIPRMNPDGVLLKSRTNFNGVDLNRNLPTKDWTAHYDNPRYYPGKEPLSEPENKILVAHISTFQPHLIISLHSWYPLINVNGNCLPQALILQKHTQYRIEEDIGYPTPGSLGTYAGHERQIPTITYEIERGAPLTDCLKLHVPAILAVFSSYS